MGVILSLFGVGIIQEDEQCKNSDRKARQDKIIEEIKEIEQCAYCYLDKRVELLLNP